MMVVLGNEKGLRAFPLKFTEIFSQDCVMLGGESAFFIELFELGNFRFILINRIWQKIG